MVEIQSRRLLDEIWNTESHAASLEFVADDFAVDDPLVSSRRTGPDLMLDLVHVYRSCIPRLRFTVRRQLKAEDKVVTYWRAKGIYENRSIGQASLGREIRLAGSFVTERGHDSSQLKISSGHWDSGTFVGSVAASKEEFQTALRPSLNRIRFRQLPGRGPVPLVLFPTLSLPGWIGWRRFIHRFRRKSPLTTFQLLGNRWAFEGRGCPEKYSVRKETLAIEDGLKRLGVLTPFDVVAHSAGGCIALDFALRNPTAIRTLTLIEPALAWVIRDANDVDPELHVYIQERMARYRAGISEAEYARFIQEAMAPHEKSDPRESPYWPDVSAYRDNMQYRKSIYMHRERLNSLKDIDFPVLLVKGRYSDRFHHRIVETLQGSIAHAKVVEMCGGHSPHLGRGLADFMRLLFSFLREARTQDSERRLTPSFDGAGAVPFRRGE